MRASTVGHRMGSGSATIMLRSSLGNSLKPGQKQMVQGGNNTRFLLTEGEFSKLFYASPPISIVRASKTICFKLQKRSLVTNTNDQMTNPKIPDSSPLETNLEDTLYEPAVPNPLPSSLIIKYGDKKAELLFDENGNSLDRYALDFNLLEECLQIALAAYNHSCIDKSNHFFPNKINFDQQCNTVYPAVTLAYAGSSGHRLIRTFGKKIAYSLQSNMLILSDEQFLRIVDHLSRHAAVDTLSSTVGSLGNRDSTLSHPKQDDEVRTKLLTFERTSAKRRSFKKISRKRSTSESLFEYWKSNKTNQNDLSDPHVLSKFFQFKQQNQENWPHFKESALLPQTRKFNECSSSGITRASDRPVLSHRMRTNPWATALDYIFSWIDELVPPTFLAPPTPDITIENKSNTPAIKAPRTGVDVPPNTVYLHGALFSTPFFTNQLHRFLKSKNCKRSFIIIEGSQDNDYPGEFDSDENYEMEEIKSDDANHDFNWLIERGIPRILLTPPIHKISPPNLVKKHQSAIKEDQSLLKLERNINVLKPLVPNEFIDLLSEAAPRTLLAERDLTPSECRILALLLSNVINCNYQNPGKISQKSELYTGLKSNSKESIIGKLKNVLSSFTGNRKLQSRALEMLQTGDKKEETQGDVEDLATRLGLDSQSLNKHEKRLLSCVVSPKQVDTKFEVIGALDDVKGLLQHLISARIKFPELFTKGILRDAVSGILLFGPPGTGKTMLARGVATESGASFIAVNASSIYDMYVGEGEKNVKALFSLARKLSPCVIFLDEMDALLDSRSHGTMKAGRIEMLNEFMSEWDGLLSHAKSAEIIGNQKNSTAGNSVIVMGATNRPFALDDAVLRRLPRRLLVDLPDQAGRESILRILLKDDSVANDVDFSEIARLTPNYSGSDLKNVARAAAERLLRRVCDSDYNKKLANINKIGHENPNCSLSMSVENADIVDSSRDQNFNQKDPIDGTKSSACESSTNLPSDSLISKSIINKSNPLNQNYNVKIASNYGSSILAASPDQMLDVKTFPEIKDERNEKNIENLADSNVKQIQITMQDLIVATEEISGSTSVNMSSIEELRRWDRQFGCRVGDSRSKRKAPSVLGFQ